MLYLEDRPQRDDRRLCSGSQRTGIRRLSGPFFFGNRALRGRKIMFYQAGVSPCATEGTTADVIEGRAVSSVRQKMHLPPSDMRRQRYQQTTTQISTFCADSILFYQYWQNPAPKLTTMRGCSTRRCQPAEVNVRHNRAHPCCRNGEHRFVRQFRESCRRRAIADCLPTERPRYRPPQR